MQYRVAAGEKLPLTQAQVRIDGHAVEARVYAEDAEHGFLPSTGTIVALELPSDIRVDTGIEAGGQVTPYYDPMIAKLIAQAPTRQATLDRLTHALDHTVIAGVRSNVAFLANLCRADEFRRGAVDTGFIERNLPRLGGVPQPRDNAAAAVGVTHLLNVTAANEAPSDDDSAPSESPGTTMTLPARRRAVDRDPDCHRRRECRCHITYAKDGARVAVDGADPATDAKVFTRGHDVYVVRGGRQPASRSAISPRQAWRRAQATASSKRPCTASAGSSRRVGDRVAIGQRLAVIEAMKMEHTLRAPFAGTVTQVPVRTGAQVVEARRSWC